jgi:hypothetical protein
MDNYLANAQSCGTFTDYSIENSRRWLKTYSFYFPGLWTNSEVNSFDSCYQHPIDLFQILLL